MSDAPDRYLVAVDPGTRTGAAVLVGIPESGAPRLIASRTLEDPKQDGDPPLAQLRRMTGALVGEAGGEGDSRVEVVVEEPSAAWHGKSNTAVMIQICRIVTRLALYVTEETGAALRLFAADSLRRSGQVLRNAERPRLFRRIYATEAPDEHVRDAGLIAAKCAGVL